MQLYDCGRLRCERGRLPGQDFFGGSGPPLLPGSLRAGQLPLEKSRPVSQPLSRAAARNRLYISYTIKIDISFRFLFYFVRSLC